MTLLAVLTLAGQNPPVTPPESPPESPPAPPPVTHPNASPDDAIRVRFRMADGVRITGTLTEWDKNGIDGTFGRREWVELDARDVWKLYRKLMNIESASQWAHLGRALLLCSLDQPQAAKNAEKAFARTVRLDQSMSEMISAIRIEVDRIKADREALEQAIASEKLDTLSPESVEWKPQPWPEISQTEQNAATLVMRADAAKMLRLVGLDIVPVETEYFLFYSDMPRRESARWARELDHMYARLADIFFLEEGKNIFWGKAVIFVFNHQKRFQLLEAQAFNHLAPESVLGLCHQRGPKVFVNFYRQPDDLAFAAVLVHETVHGFMHRYQTPQRLPVWANEGFADYVASISFRNSPIDGERRKTGVAFIRAGGDVRFILNLSYLDGSWPGEDAIGYPVSYLLVSLMIRERPRNFGRWVQAVKAGKDWKQALADEFGVTDRRLIERFTRYHLVND